MSNSRILDLVHSVVKTENLFDYHVQVHGNSGKGDGYLGRITFITVNGKTKENEPKTLNIVVKTSTQNKLLRDQIPIQKCFEKEIYVYKDILPAFVKFQQETKSQVNPQDLLPICYLTKSFEGSEALIIENLKAKGFDVWNKLLPMTDDHIRLVLEAYGKWHAFPLALRKKHPQDFEKLVKNNQHLMWAHYIEKTGLYRVIFRWCEEARNYWKHDQNVPQMKFSEEEIKFILTKLFREDSEYSVLLHADNWTNNFMFKNQKNGAKPVDVKLIDWQLCGFASPILDLSFFIYCCTDTGEYSDVKLLLKVYYDSLSKCLTQQGCNSEEVFSFDLLLQHWKKYSCYGVIFGTFLLKFCLSDSEEAPDFVKTAEKGEDFLENFKFNIANEETYFKRVKDNIVHYIKNLK